MLTYLSPTFTSIAGVLLLSERVTIWRAGGVVLGLAGVLVLVWAEMTTKTSTVIGCTSSG